MKKIDKPLYEHLGRQLREARMRKGYSLAEVADMIGKSKVSIKRYEDATVRVDMETLERLCTVLDVKPQTAYISTGNKILERIMLTPIPKDDSPLPLEIEEKTAEQKKEEAFDAISDRFVKLDENNKRIVLMMLKFNEDEIKEILESL